MDDEQSPQPSHQRHNAAVTSKKSSPPQVRFDEPALPSKRTCIPSAYARPSTPMSPSTSPTPAPSTSSSAVESSDEASAQTPSTPRPPATNRPRDLKIVIAPSTAGSSRQSRMTMRRSTSSAKRFPVRPTSLTPATSPQSATSSMPPTTPVTATNEATFTKPPTTPVHGSSPLRSQARRACIPFPERIEIANVAFKNFFTLPQLIGLLEHTRALKNEQFGLDALWVRQQVSYKYPEYALEVGKVMANRPIGDPGMFGCEIPPIRNFSKGSEKALPPSQSMTSKSGKETPMNNEDDNHENNEDDDAINAEDTGILGASGHARSKRERPTSVFDLAQMLALDPMDPKNAAFMRGSKHPVVTGASKEVQGGAKPKRTSKECILSKAKSHENMRSTSTSLSGRTPSSPLITKSRKNSGSRSASTTQLPSNASSVPPTPSTPNSPYSKAVQSSIDLGSPESAREKNPMRKLLGMRSLKSRKSTDTLKSAPSTSSRRRASDTTTTVGRPPELLDSTVISPSGMFFAPTTRPKVTQPPAIPRRATEPLEYFLKERRPMTEGPLMNQQQAILVANQKNRHREKHALRVQTDFAQGPKSTPLPRPRLITTIFASKFGVKNWHFELNLPPLEQDAMGEHIDFNFSPVRLSPKKRSAWEPDCNGADEGKRRGTGDALATPGYRAVLPSLGFKAEDQKRPRTPHQDEFEKVLSQALEECKRQKMKQCGETPQQTVEHIKLSASRQVDFHKTATESTESYGKDQDQGLPIFVYGELACPEVLARVLGIAYPKRLARYMTPAELENWIVLGIRMTDGAAAVDAASPQRTSIHHDSRQILEQEMDEKLTMKFGPYASIAEASVEQWFGDGEAVPVSTNRQPHGSRRGSQTSPTVIKLQKSSTGGSGQSTEQLWVRGFLVFGLSRRQKYIIDNYCGENFEATMVRVKTYIRIPETVSKLSAGGSDGSGIQSPPLSTPRANTGSSYEGNPGNEENRVASDFANRCQVAKKRVEESCKAKSKTMLAALPEEDEGPDPMTQGSPTPREMKKADQGPLVEVEMRAYVFGWDSAKAQLAKPSFARRTSPFANHI